MKIANKINKILVLLFAFCFCVLIFSAPSYAEESNKPLSSDEAKIISKNGIHEISFLIPKPNQYREKNGNMLISVETPSSSKVKAEILPFKSSSLEAFGQKNLNSASELQPFLLKEITSPVETLSTAFPPSPNGEGKWNVFSIDLSKQNAFSNKNVSVSFEVEEKKDIDFTRVLIGRPSTPNSRVLGAFKSADNKTERKDGVVIKAGEDYLGTISAIQHFRIPANTFSKNTEAFDEMVEFEGAPFNPKHDNVDTVMIRTRDITVPGTTPVQLTKFANKSKNPIKIRNGSDGLEFAVTARLSPKKKSGGFVTILADGTYRSTTSLYPLLEFQRVQNGKALGKPIFVDTAITPVPGFPFYLASEGGKWIATPPEERFLTDASSNFFYNNGNVNTFTHSNGLNPSTVAKCAKESAKLTN